jgi:hypothetical protein
VKILCVIATDDHGESVFETERFGDFEVEAVGVALFDAIEDGGRFELGGFVEDGGERSACVLDVEVEIAGEKSFVDKERAAEICFAFDGDAGAGFDVLGEEFGEDDLLGEEFGADGDMGFCAMAGRNKVEQAKE